MWLSDQIIKESPTPNCFKQYWRKKSFHFFSSFSIFSASISEESNNGIYCANLIMDLFFWQVLTMINICNNQIFVCHLMHTLPKTWCTGSGWGIARSLNNKQMVPLTNIKTQNLFLQARTIEQKLSLHNTIQYNWKGLIDFFSILSMLVRLTPFNIKYTI